MKTQVTVNHIGLTVTNIEEAITWYANVFGFELITGPLPLTNDDTHFGQLSRDIFGNDFKGGQFAHLKTADGIGIELFSFNDPVAMNPENTMEYRKNGIFHFCITHPDPVALADMIVANGGKQRTQNWDIFPGGDRKLVYCQDPWGNVIEIYSHSYQETWNYLLETAKQN